MIVVELRLASELVDNLFLLPDLVVKNRVYLAIGFNRVNEPILAVVNERVRCLLDAATEQFATGDVVRAIAVGVVGVAVRERDGKIDRIVESTKLIVAVRHDVIRY